MVSVVETAVSEEEETDELEVAPPPTGTSIPHTIPASPGVGAWGASFRAQVPPAASSPAAGVHTHAPQSGRVSQRSAHCEKSPAS